MKALGSCEYGTFMMAFKAPTLGVLGWPDSSLGHHPVVEVPATHLLWDPMQENQERFLLTPHMLPVLVNASSFAQSDILTLVVRLQPNTERLKPLAEFLAMWQCLPDVSQWVPRTIRHGYTKQFSPPSRESETYRLYLSALRVWTSPQGW